MILNGLRRNAGGKSATTGLLLLSSLWALGTLRADLLPGLLPNLLPHLERQTIPLALLAVIAGVFAAMRRMNWPRGRQLGSAALIGLGLFAVPSLLLYFADVSIPAAARVALFSLVIVFAVVFEPYVGGDAVRQSRGALLAALACVLGALCVFPLQFPGSIEDSRAFFAVILAAACVAGANCIAVRAATEFEGKPVAPAAAIAAATAALGLALASTVQEHAIFQWKILVPELAWSACVEAPALMLLFWLMPRMSAARMATRYTIAPLFALLIGVLVLRPPLGLWTCLGLLLMAIGAAYLLLAPDEEPVPAYLTEP